MSEAKNFYLFGSPIQHSLSPLLHNTGFQHYNLPYKYALFDTTDINSVEECLKRSDTAGGSVTIPHKQAVMKFITHLSDSAKAIGAVNTITKNEQGELCGDNTDWQAIFGLIQRNLQQTGRHSTQDLSGLVIGAGGTAQAACYALKQLGIPFRVFNRTIEKARDLAARFGAEVCDSLETLGNLDVIVSTVPPTSNLRLPTSVFHPNLIVVELVYHPRITPLLAQAKEANCRIVEGIEILFEQGLKQFQVFTNHKYSAPRQQIAQAFIERFDGGALRVDTPPTFLL